MCSIKHISLPCGNPPASLTLNWLYTYKVNSMLAHYGDVIIDTMASQNNQPHHCLLNRLFGCRSKKTSKLRVTDLCAGNSPGTGEFPAQMASNAENVSIWWSHHAIQIQDHLHMILKFKFKFKSRLFQLLHIRSTKIQGTETLLGLFAPIIWP